MRMRRILAFVLAVVMLMGNTVTASATSASSTPISGNYNITTGENGETIISPIDVEDEDELSEEGQEVTPPADNGGEPNGGDVGTGDEGLNGGDDSNGDESGDDTDIPGGDDDNNDDINSGEEGGDIDEPNGEDGEGEDPEAPAEGEEITTEEETTEEETTEELPEAPLLKAVADSQKDAGEIVTVFINNTPYYFTTIADAIDYIDSNVASGTYCYISLDAGESYSVSGDDLVSTSGADITLGLSQDISVTADNGTTVQVNISIQGSEDEQYSMNLADRVSLQLIEGSNKERNYFRNFDINFSADDAGDFIVGEENASVAENDSDATVAYFTGVNMNNVEDAYFYAGFQNEYVYQNGGLCARDEVSFVNVTIALPERNDSTHFYPEVYFGVPVKATTLNLDGSLWVNDFTVNGYMTATDTSSLYAFGALEIDNFSATRETADNCFNIWLYDSYAAGTPNRTWLGTASLKFSGYLDASLALSLNKSEAVFTNDGWDAEQLDYEIGDTIATVTLGEEEELNGCSLVNPNNYGIWVPSTAYWYLEPVATEDETDGNTYDLVIKESPDEIAVWVDQDGDDSDNLGYSFANFQDVKDFILEDESAARYMISVNESDLEVSGDVLDYSSFKGTYQNEEGQVVGAKVYLGLNGNTLKVTDNATIAVDSIDGGCYNENGEIAGSFSDISLAEKEGITLTLAPRTLEQWGNYSISSYAIRILSNASNIKIGREVDWATSEAHMGITFVNEVKSMDLYGRVNIESTSQTNVINNLYVHNVSENNNWQEAYITNMTVKHLYATEGNVGFDKVNVTNTLYLKSGQNFSVKAGGSAEIKNVEVWENNQNPGACASFEVERTMKLAADDDLENPTFIGATEKVKTSTIKITGTVDRQENAQPIMVRKLKGWEYTTTNEEGYEVHHYNSRTEEFVNGETVITSTNTTVSPDSFWIEGAYRFLQRSSTALKAAGAVLRVCYGEEESYKEVLYTSFEDAVKNMPADFDGVKGEYHFIVLNDTKLTANVTLPDFVTTAHFDTESAGWYDEANDIWNNFDETRYQKFLDLNGKTLTVKGDVRLEGGVRMLSSVSTRAKLVVNTYWNDALRIDESCVLVEGVDEETHEYIPVEEPAMVLENIAVSAPNKYIILHDLNVWEADDAEQDDAWNGLDATFDAFGLIVEGGNWVFADNNATYIKVAMLSIYGSNIDDESRPEEDPIVEAASLSCANITVQSGHLEVAGDLDAYKLTVSNIEDFSINGNVNVYDLAATNTTINVMGNLCVNHDVTLNNSNLLEYNHVSIGNILAMTNKSQIEVWNDFHAKEISSAASKILVAPEGSGSLYTDKISVTTAFAGDTLGDYTLQNNGQILVRDTLSMTAGTLENAGLIEADTLTLKDFNNSCCWCPDEEGGHDQFGHILCNTITNTGKAYLGRESHLLINTSGTLNNVNVGDRYGDNGDALVGRSQDATVTFKGTFTRNDEEQKLLGVVTDYYDQKAENADNKIGDYTVIGESDEQYNEYHWDWIELPDERLLALEAEDVLFKTEIAKFPVDAIRVLPWTVAEGENRIDNVNNSVYQSGKELKVTGEYIRVSMVASNGENWLKDFTNWNDAVAYINALNNPTATYVIGIRADMDIEGKLTFPTKAAHVVICSDKGYHEYDEEGNIKKDENGYDIWISEQVRLSFQGDITQSSDVDFVNVDLEPYTLSSGKKVAYASTIDTKGKLLNLDHVSIKKYGTDEDTSLKAVKGTTSTQFNIQNETDLVVDTKISGINEIYLAFGSSLEVTGGISVNNLVTVNWYGEYENPFVIKVNGASSVLEVKTRLNMYSPTRVECDGSMKLKDVYTNCEGNVLQTDAAGKITISGRVLAADDHESFNHQWDKVPVVAMRDGENNIIGYRYATEDERNGLEVIPDADYAEKMPYAIMVEAGTGVPNTVLATAAQVSPIWFIAPSNVEGCDFDMTRKVGNNIISGSNTNNAVILSALFGEDEEGNRILKEMNRFGKLEEAFAEIDKIAAPTFTYVITLNDSVAMLNSSNKPADYTFPKQAAEVIITSNGEAKTISYNKELKLQSNVAFENVVLSANTTGGNVALDKFTLRLSDVDFAEQNAEGKVIAYNITGSGVGKGSRLVVEDCDGQDNTLAVAKLSKVDIVGLVRANIAVGGDTEIGNLYVEHEETFIGLGKITMANIYSSENPTTIVTAPKLTLADKGKATEKVTKVEANMTVSGVIEGSVNFELHGIDADLVDGKLTFEKAGLDSLATGAGLAFVKATNANTEMATVFGSNEYIYKKAGVFTYKSVGPQVELSYDDTTSTFETFADAVTEINNLKTKRDYTIRFIETSASAPVTLTMPKAGMVDTLVLTAAEDVNVYYVKDIKFDSNVVLEDINFIQMVEVNKEYVDKSTAIYMPEVDKYFDPVKVTINGAYTFDVTGAVTFNTPIALSGAKKATFVADGDGALFASAQDKIWEDATGVIIEGTIKDFAVLDVTADMLMEGYLAGKPSAATQTYKAAEINVTTFNIANEAQIYVGDSRQTVDSVTVTNLNMSGGDLTSWGNGVFTNVTLSDNPYIAVYGQKFNITGTLTSATENALLVTVLDAKKLTSVLNVSGSVVLQNPDSHAIWVNVVGPDEGFDLGGTYTDEGGKTQTYSNKLLTASKASLNAFLAYSACVGGRDLYDAENNEDGYILKKSGSDFLVYYAEDVEVALYTVEGVTNEGELIVSTPPNYYISFNEAVAAIDALKDTSADYAIELINNVGGEIIKDAVTYEKINLPSKAASLTIYSENGEAIYYNNDLTLGCNTLISEVDLKPQIANKKEKGIALKGYELVLDRIQTDKIGKITGNNKNDKLTVLANQNLTLAGDITGVADFELLAENESSAEITVTGKLTVKNLIFETDAVNLTVQGKGSSVTDIRSISEDVADNRLSFAEMTVNGAIKTDNPDSRLELNNTSVSTAAKYNGNKLDLVATSKLATISKAAITNVDFFAKGTPVTNAQWSAKSVYNVEANANAVTVSKEDGTLLVTCVDLAQASAYIDTMADKSAKYVINIEKAIADTVVTDTAAVGKITLPAKDKMASVVVDGADEVNPAIAFSGDIATNGVVTLKDIKLANTADFSISNKKNSDTKVDGEKVAGKGELTLDNVVVNTYVEKGVVKGNLKNISGEKNVTKLAIVNSVQGNLNAVGGITNISKMTLINTALTTVAKSEVSILKLASGGAWVGYGATVIGTVENEEQSDQSYLGTYLAKGVPQMTINGSVSKPVMMKLYDFATKKEIYEARPIADANKTQAELYQNQPLVVAKTEASDKFIAEPFAIGEDGNWEFNNASVQARKDAKNYVYNGDISGMEVLLVASVDGAGDTETYVATYADAINIINNIGNKNADYTVKLRATGSNIVDGVSEIKTAGKDGVAAYGSLALPTANKAKSLTIKSEDAQVRLAYTGTMAPKCNLNFENVILTEGTTKTVDGKVVFTPSNFVTPALSTANINVRFGEDVSTLNAHAIAVANIADDDEMYGVAQYNLVFSKVTSIKGTVLDICSNAAYVIGDAAIATLQAENYWDEEAQEDKEPVLSVKGKATITDVAIADESILVLTSKNAIKVTNIVDGGELVINTTYTNKDWYKATPQLTIDGELESGTGLTICQYMYDVSEKTYRLLNDDEVEDVTIEPEDKPAAYQKLITAPKLQVSDDVRIETDAERDCYLFKMDGVVYLSLYPAYIDVVGYDDEGETYKGSFFTWEQAIKEIDKLNHGPSTSKNNPDAGWSYDIILREDIGANGNPIKTLTLPAKAAKVTIVSETGDEGIMMTGTSVSLKTNLEIRVPIVAMKKTGNNYYRTAYTLNAGNYGLILNEVPTGADFDNMGWNEPQFKLSGSSKGVVTVIPGYVEENRDSIYSGMITQISSVGTVILDVNEDAIFFNEETERDEIRRIDYEIKDGISGVGELVLKAGASARSGNKDVNVKKLTIGESVAPVVDENAEGNQVWNEDGYVNTYISNSLHSHMEAKNITVSDTLTMASASLKAGTSTVGDGKITLTNVVFEDNHNNIEAKQDKNGKSQIQIKGTVSAAGENILTRDAAVSVGLFYNNSSRNYAQLTEGMVLLIAPKAASSWFWPEYENMGGMPIVVRSDENDPENTWEEPTFKLYKSGNDIKYGRVLAQDEHGNFSGELIEARVWIGGTPGTTSYMEFMTFEEAVKAIDSMGLQDEVLQGNKKVKVYKDYYIEILSDIEIGNAKGDGKYSALTLPAKANIVDFRGNGYELRFAGNVTLKCTTVFTDLNLVPMKSVKGGAVETTTNVAIGNFYLGWLNSNCDEARGGFGDLSECNSYINNITGGAKGELSIIGTSKLKANNITGLNKIWFVPGEGDYSCWYEYSDEFEAGYADYNENCGQILTDGNVTVKELWYMDKSEGILRVRGNLTTNVIYVTGECNAQIWNFNNKPIKVNGSSNASVIYISEGNSNNIKVKTVATDGVSVATGTKIVTGKYLNEADWDFYSFLTGDNTDTLTEERTPYMAGADLYMGETR